MIIGLHDAEKDYFKHGKIFPNYALMKISAWHKSKGDQVEWWNPLYRYDLVYSSKVFDFTQDDPYLPTDAIRGGTGYRDIPIDHKLPQKIDDMFPDYSTYPECDYAIGYLTRGCIRKCRWCVVPRKEGHIGPYRDWTEIVRKDTDKLVLMDNNILACEPGINHVAEILDKHGIARPYGWEIAICMLLHNRDYCEVCGFGSDAYFKMIEYLVINKEENRR